MARKSIQIRVDERLKKQVERILTSLGLDMPTAVRMFFTKVVVTGGIPFSVRGNEDHYTPEEMAEIQKAYEESFDPKNVSGPFETVDELFADLEKNDICS